jgi:hypothetical protein
VLLTRKENAEFTARAKFRPTSDMEEALRLAYELCGTPNPKITVMPQGANTLPILKKNL